MENTSDLTQPTSLGELISYQKDAIVSKTIVEKKIGTVTLFAFDQGQGLSEHTTPFDALVYLLDGEAFVTISGKRSNVKSGEIILMPAHKPHAVTAKKKFKMLLVMIQA